MNISLYQLAAEHRAVAEQLADLDMDPQTVADTLEAMSGDLEAKAQNVVFFARNLEAVAASIKDAEKAMADRRKAMEKRADHLREYVQQCMETAGIKSIECPHFKLALQANPPSVDVFEPGLIPASFMRQPEPPPPAPDKTAIKDAIKAGQDVPGARLISSTRLVIK